MESRRNPFGAGCWDLSEEVIAAGLRRVARRREKNHFLVGSVRPISNVLAYHFGSRDPFLTRADEAERLHRVPSGSYKIPHSRHPACDTEWEKSNPQRSANSSISNCLGKGPLPRKSGPMCAH